MLAWALLLPKRGLSDAKMLPSGLSLAHPEFPLGRTCCTALIEYPAVGCMAGTLRKGDRPLCAPGLAADNGSEHWLLSCDAICPPRAAGAAGGGPSCCHGPPSHVKISLAGGARSARREAEVLCLRAEMLLPGGACSAWCAVCTKLGPALEVSPSGRGPRGSPWGPSPAMRPPSIRLCSVSRKERSVKVLGGSSEEISTWWSTRHQFRKVFFHTWGGLGMPCKVVARH